MLHVDIASQAAFSFICWDGFNFLWEIVFYLSIYA